MDQSIETIIKNLEWFNIKDIISAKKELEVLGEKHELIDPTKYYQQYLMPLIPNLFKASREIYGLWPCPDGVRFRGILQMAFEGYFPIETLKKCWDQMLVEEQIVRSRDGHGPYLLKAIENNYLAGLSLLFQMFQTYAGKSSQNTYEVVQDLKFTLEKLFRYKQPVVIGEIQIVIQKIQELQPPESCNTEELNKALESMIQLVETKSSTILLPQKGTPTQRKSEIKKINLIEENLDHANPNNSNSGDGELLSKKLQHYINRVEEYKDINGGIDFSHGFFFFSSSRAINRQANYLLAKDLLNKLQTNPVEDVFNNINDTRLALIKENRLHDMPSYSERGINSSELNAIIEAAENNTSRSCS